jgi:hypothetical protein
MSSGNCSSRTFPAEIILEALDRSSDLTLRGIRGIIGEATFVLEIIPQLKGWKNIMPEGEHPYDALLEDAVTSVKVQCKMQRRLKGQPLIRHGNAIVEVQRTRAGMRNGENTRPYKFGEFEVLAVCMEPSHGRWNSFQYIPERWLFQRTQDPKLIDILQPVSLTPDHVWTNDFDEVVSRLRSDVPRPKTT